MTGGVQKRALADGKADLIAFGMPFIANPDLVDRFGQDAPLALADGPTLRGGGARGYTDYPRLIQAPVSRPL